MIVDQKVASIDFKCSNVIDLRAVIIPFRLRWISMDILSPEVTTLLSTDLMMRPTATYLQPLPKIKPNKSS